MNRFPASAAADDAALMVRVQADDCDAFGMLYDRFAIRAYGVARAVCADDSRAEDIVREAFLSVWRGRASYRPEDGSLVGWVMGIVQQRAIDALRSGNRRPADGHIDDRLAAPGSTQDTVVEREQAARLGSTLARLPAAQRDVIILAYFGNLSTSEIARDLSLPVGTVNGRMRLGLSKLRADDTP